MKIFDPSFAIRLARLVQAKGTNVEAPQDLPFAGLVITIPGEALFENLAGETGKRAAGIAKTEFSDPVNGTDFLVTVPAGEAWRMIALHANLVTSAAVATRSAYLFIDGGSVTRPLYRDAIPSGTGQAASLTWNYSWALGVQIMQETGNGKLTRPVPDIVLLPGYRIQTNTLNIQAGDSWEIVTLLFEKASYR